MMFTLLLVVQGMNKIRDEPGKEQGMYKKRDDRGERETTSMMREQKRLTMLGMKGRIRGAIDVLGHGGCQPLTWARAGWG